ncbi:hypothetical protein BC477_16785 [Clavibacter michiganensis subsp. michiganensis]|uniref:Uncharacterized protein n=1 Tax=Clavibacter michiganensis subsp. michiganensis TaxID=33013 RepID=A0A251XE32_CLAMM|nr:hypothetical protein BC477_16785 [Clavibacter michiganensis subsp. michiganensis]OUE00436.1 hypothetical protein CMMCAS07_18715 [Clavibacter michiganensis subsp. michiganensis]
MTTSTTNGSGRISAPSKWMASAVVATGSATAATAASASSRDARQRSSGSTATNSTA